MLFILGEVKQILKTLYVSDLDGTLLNRQDYLSEYTIDIVNTLVKKGMIFTYATARSLSSASIVTKGLTTNIPVIIYNGSFILNATTGEILSSVTFDDMEKQSVVQLLKKYKIYPLVYAYIHGIEKVSWITSKQNDGFKRYFSLRKGDRRLNPLSSEKDLFAGNVFYFTCIGEKEELLPIYETFKDNSNYNCILQQELYREEYWCEIMPRKATKANAIQQLKTILNCDKIISFGDAVNDISMFSISDECYAVKNAVPELKNIATDIIDGNDEDGVAKWLDIHCEL
jgi:Cof subfamily protein (haloacid dehalogenase superfamily)